MIWLIVASIAVLVLSWFAIWIVATRSVVKSIGQPTPKEAQIQRNTEEVTQKIFIGAQDEKAKVQNATAGDLLNRARDELRDKK